MASTKHLLAIKKLLKTKQPAFLRRNFKKNKRSRVAGNWRAPRGLHNKLRRRRRGIGQWVMPGYKMPKRVRGLTREGLLPVLAENLHQVKALAAEKHALILKSSVGIKKRMEMVKEAVQKKMTIINLKDPAAWLKKMEAVLDEKKKAKKQKEEKKETKEQKKEAKAEKTEEKEKIALSPEDQKKEEKKEMEKVLTKKE